MDDRTRLVGRSTAAMETLTMTGQSNRSSRRRFLAAGGTAAAGAIAWSFLGAGPATAASQPTFVLTDAQWKKRLSPQAYYVLRQEGTEKPYTSPLNKEYRKGRFLCAGCDLPLFSSATKYDSKTGWPSFWNHLPRAIATRVDNKLEIERTEVICARCHGHLGHVFDDGPEPTGKRYCMNGLALKFVPA